MVSAGTSLSGIVGQKSFLASRGLVITASNLEKKWPYLLGTWMIVDYDLSIYNMYMGVYSNTLCIYIERDVCIYAVYV